MTLSGGFWLGVVVIVLCSVTGFVALTSGHYRDFPAYPVRPLPAAIVIAATSAVAFWALWRWERHRDNEG